MVLYLWIMLQILLESLPVSSSGHVALMQKYISNWGNISIPQNQLWMIDFLLHGPMILILLLFFFKTWWQMIFQKHISLKALYASMRNHKTTLLRDREEARVFWKRFVRLMLFGLIADGITVFFWQLHIVPSISLTVGFSITALLLYATRYCKETSHTFDADFIYATLLGIGQSISFSPGISRFATTYAVGRFCGYSGRIAFAVSFMIQFPLIVAAFIRGIVVVQKYPELIRNFFDFKVLFVILAASIVSYVLLRWVDNIIKRNKLWLFSWYMLIPIVLTLFV